MILAQKDEEFLDGVEACFLAQGYRNITVGELATRLKCSRRRLYSYADSKEALFYLVLERFFERIQIQGRARARVEKRFEAKIDAYLEAGVRGASKLSIFIQEDIAASAQGQKIYDDHQMKRMDGLRILIEQGIERGVFRQLHSLVVAETMFAIVRRIRQPEFQKKTNVSYSEALTEVWSILRFGILANADTQIMRKTQNG